MQAEIENVKSTLSDGTASEVTLKTLQSLLDVQDSSQQFVSAASSRTTVPRLGNSRASATAPRKPTTKIQLVVKNHDGGSLSTKTKQAFATDIVNITLKVLTATAKARQAVSRDASTIPAPLNDAQSVSRAQRALQPLSGNTTPSPKKPELKKETTKDTIKGGAVAAQSGLAATAECACIAFQYLLSADTKASGVKAGPKSQLENGLLALAGRLISLRQDATAVKCLRFLKRRLEPAVRDRLGAPPSRQAGRAKSTAQPERATLATLLHLDPAILTTPDVLGLAVSHQHLVLKIIVLTRNPAIIEAVHEEVAPSAATAPSNIIVAHGELSGDLDRAAKQLESLASSILSLCPSVSSASDAIASDPRNSISSGTAFKLQTTALCIRQKWWKMAGHDADLENELRGPFLRCLTALVRRTSDTSSMAYELAQSAYAQLDIALMTADSDFDFEFCRLMASLADRTATPSEAARWIDRMSESCEDSDARRARAVACLAERLRVRALSKKGPRDNELLRLEMEDLSQRMKTSLAGQGTDHDFLLSALSHLLGVQTGNWYSDLDYATLQRLTARAAGFAQRYARSYPGKNTEQALAITLCALRCSSTPEHLDFWLSKDTIRLLIKVGSLDVITMAASSRPLNVAWTSSSNAVALGRVLNALLLGAVRKHGKETFFDDENVADMARATLLEWQLSYAIDLAGRPKYHDWLRSCIGDMMRTLSKLYVAHQHPIRRARVAACAFRLRSSHPDLLPPHMLKTWEAEILFDEKQLGEDEGLRPYLADVKACLAVSKAFCGDAPQIESLIPAIRVWKSIIIGSNAPGDIHSKVEDCSRLWSILQSVADYMSVTGHMARIAVLRVLTTLSDLVGTTQQQAMAKGKLSHAYLEIGHAEKAELAFSRSEGHCREGDTPLVAQLLLHTEYAEYALATDKVDAAHDHLAIAQALRARLPPESIPRHDRRTYEALHVRAYLTRSTIDRSKGGPQDALEAAKRAVQLASGIWRTLERSTGCEDRTAKSEHHEAEASDIQRLTTGVSKLQLTPKDDQKDLDSTGPNDRGAAFWPILPLMCKALHQLSDLYADHGLFEEADIYLKRAIELAERVKASTILCQSLCRRCRLLVSAGDIQKAELCLTRAEEIDVVDWPLLDAERRSAKAALRAAKGEAKQAIQAYDQAVSLLDNARLSTYLAKLETLGEQIHEPAKQSHAFAVDPSSQPVRPKSIKNARAPAKKTAIKKSVVRASNAKVTPPCTTEREAGECYLLAKFIDELVIEKSLLCLQSDSRSGAADLVAQMPTCTTRDLRQHRFQFHVLMQKASAALQSDLSYNMLPESTIAFPSFSKTSRISSQAGRSRSSLLLPTSAEQAPVKSMSKASARKAQEIEGFHATLQAAKDCVSQASSSMYGLSTTVDTHRFGSMQSNVAMLLSASSLKQPNGYLHPTRQALDIELPRMYAWQCEISTVLVDQASRTDTAPFAWPQAALQSDHIPLTAAAFQENYIDILPSTWTALSLTLDEDTTELYATRYRAGQLPFILRLPFARHREDEEDQQIFDYHCGKAELKDIIQASDYTCHSTGNMDAKGAKSDWWVKREELDRRLHELLINMENIWFGGFKGIMSPQRRYSDLLAQFSKSFDDILARYLPSRRSTKGRQEAVTLDYNVLELFVGLGHDSDGAVDMDEPLADLLYFVVDMLQFSGERNAYDEIDFDGMAVDVLDALRSYHDAVPDDRANSHLILVLDKRLQAFPWESMSCLEGASVSRVGNLQSLRERIVTMRTQWSNARVQDRYQVSRMGGTYILNPSKDLKGTEAMLSPSLAILSTGRGSWTSIVQQVPSENDFSSALSDSSILLYFGHGSGAQYMRPRNIKKLNKCSEVVWLMGCSSGAVKEHGELEPSAVPLAYLMAGTKHTSFVDTNYDEARTADGKCLAVVATLWDVTDKDIDRFSLAMGEKWGLFKPSEGSKLPPKTPRKRTPMAITSSPQKVPKTPKTPRVAKTPAKASARSRSVSRVRQVDDGNKSSLVAAVSKSRDACYLRYLNGAAPVVYGVPVYLGD